MQVQFTEPVSNDDVVRENDEMMGMPFAGIMGMPFANIGGMPQK